MQKKAEIPYFTNQKFFTPSLVFYPHFPTLKWDYVKPASRMAYCVTHIWSKMGVKTSESGKNFWFVKYGMPAFFLHQKACKNIENSWKSILLKIEKKNFFSSFFGKVWKKSFFFSSIFKKIDFRSFSRFLHAFWCKRKLRFHTLQIKSLLPH